MAAGALLLAAALWAAEAERLLGGPVSDGLPAGWEVQTFPKVERRTRYDVSEEGGRLVVHAKAEASASGLRRRVSADLTLFPRLRWSWRAEVLPRGEAPRKKSGDDFAARVYVAFQKPAKDRSFLEKAKGALVRKLYGEEPPTAAISYVWSGTLARGEALPNAYTDRVRMLAVRGKEDPPGSWQDEERDLAADYKKLFGEDPPPLAGVSLMCDADDTRSSAAASFAGLELAP